MLDPNSGLDVMLPVPQDELLAGKLIGDLTAVKVGQITSASKIQVESKDKIKERLGRSTDVGDAVVQALVGPHLLRELEMQGTAEYTYRPARLGHEL